MKCNPPDDAMFDMLRRCTYVQECSRSEQKFLLLWYGNAISRYARERTEISLRSRRNPPKGNVRRVAAIDRNLRGTFTNKTDHIVQFESFEERILTLQFERDPNVKDYRSQPLTFNFTDQSKKERKYTPDFIVWRRDNTIEIHEVTISERRKRLSSREREEAAQKICTLKGWKYLVHTEQTLPQETETANLLALFPYRLKRYAQQDVVHALLEHLSRVSNAPLAGCSNSISHLLSLPESTVFGVLCHLLWHEKISADLRSSLLIIDCEFNPAVEISLSEKSEKER
jgi:hypothetical protein